MDLKEHLTNEKVSKKFKSQFELVTYAISLATNMIQSGRDARVKIDSQNRAMQVLSEILNDKDKFDEIIQPIEIEEVQTKKYEDVSTSKSADRKKNRKIFID